MRHVTAGLWLQVAGPLRLWRDGVEIDAGPRQQRRLLALLAVRDGQPASIADLIDLMWEIEAPPSAVNIPSVINFRPDVVSMRFMALSPQEKSL